MAEGLKVLDGFSLHRLPHAHRLRLSFVSSDGSTSSRVLPKGFEELRGRLRGLERCVWKLVVLICLQAVAVLPV